MPAAVTAMTTDSSTLYRLLAWLSPAFPVGAYSYSHALEWAVEDGLVADEAGLGRWIDGVLRFGSGRQDAVLARAAWEGVANDDAALVDWAIETGAVMRASAELALESAAQGKAFLDAALAAWPLAGLEHWAGRFALLDRPACYPVAFAMAAGAAGMALAPALEGFLHAFAANLVSAGVRLVPLGQTAGQRAIAALETTVWDLAGEVTETPLGQLRRDIGGAQAMVDWASSRHETQYTRLFRS